MADETTTPSTTPKANGESADIKAKLAEEAKALEAELRGIGKRVHDLSVKAQLLLQWPTKP